MKYWRNIHDNKSTIQRKYSTKFILCNFNFNLKPNTIKNFFKGFILLYLICFGLLRLTKYNRSTRIFLNKYFDDVFFNDFDLWFTYYNYISYDNIVFNIVIVVCFIFLMDYLGQNKNITLFFSFSVWVLGFFFTFLIPFGIFLRLFEHFNPLGKYGKYTGYLAVIAAVIFYVCISIIIQKTKKK